MGVYRYKANTLISFYFFFYFIFFLFFLDFIRIWYCHYCCWYVCVCLYERWLVRYHEKLLTEQPCEVPTCLYCTNTRNPGVFFLGFGVVTFFDSALLAFGNVCFFFVFCLFFYLSMGPAHVLTNDGYMCVHTGTHTYAIESSLIQILFLIGLTLIIGPQKTLSFFVRPQKIKGSICFLAGFALILFKHSIIGFLVECFGILVLFGDFFGVIVSFLRSMPVIGPLLSSPHVAPVSIATYSTHTQTLSLSVCMFSIANTFSFLLEIDY